MNTHINKTLRILMIVSVIQLIHSCQDPLYDFNKGIDTEIAVGGDSLTIPIGTTDTIRLKDFLSTDDIEFLEIMEDGGYGLKLSDSLYINDVLKDLDKSKLKFADYIFSESTSINFGDISLDEFKIPGFTKRDTMGLNIPKVDIGDIEPAVAISKEFTVSFSEYSLDENQLELSDFSKETGKENLLATLIPFDIPIHPEHDFTSSQPIEIKDDNGNPLTIIVNYSIEVPDGVTKIHQIDLEAGAALDISIEMDNTTELILKQGTFKPDISIDPTDLFKFNPLTPLSNGKVVYGASEEEWLTNFNSYKGKKKTYQLDALHELPTALNNMISIENSISVTGSMSAQGTLKANMAQEAKKIDLIVKVVIRDLKIKNMDFDIPTFTTSLSGTSSFAINETGLPSQVKNINKLYFEKASGSTLPTNMVIEFKPSNLPVMKSSVYKIDNMNITFPTGFVFSNMAGRTYSTSNVNFNTDTGFKVELNLSEMDMSTIPISNGSLTWSGDISYSGQISVNGRMESKNINPASDPVISMSSKSAIKLKSATVVTNLIEEQIEPSVLALELDIDIAEQVARLTTINMKRGGMIRVNINRPVLPLNLKATNMKVQFSDLFEFYPQAGLNANAFTINGPIPDFIELELKALHINKDLVNGRLSLRENITISGGVQLESGTVNSAEISDLSGSKLITHAIVSDLYIESTSVEMKTLEASYSDSTSINMQINDIPTEIVSLDSIILKAGSSIALEISVTNLPDLGGKPLNADLKLKFPKLLAFAPGQVNANNEMTISEAFVNGKLSKTINLTGLKFDGSNLGGVLNINEKVGFDVAVKVENPTINSEDLTNDPITVGVKVTIKGLEFQKVYGKFNVDFDDQLDIPNLTFDLPDVLKGEDVVLDIANPVLRLTTVSNIGIPVDAELGLTKYIGSQLMTNDKIKFNFRLPKTNSAAESVSTNYWVSPSEDGKPAHYTYLQTDLQNLFKPVPDSVKIEIKPTVDTSVQHFIDLQAAYNLKVNYDINIPFSFGKDLSITIKDTLENIDLGLQDLDVKTGSLELFGTIINSIPLNLEMQLLLVDANFKILATTTGQTIQAGAPDGSGVASKLSIKLATNLDELKTLNKVILTFKATSNSTVAGTPIKPDNYVTAELKARIGGIKVKL